MTNASNVLATGSLFCILVVSGVVHGQLSDQLCGEKRAQADNGLD